MRPLWTGSELSRAVGGEVAGALPDAVTGISIDSRTVSEGEAFFAIKGDRFDGHDFVAGAFDDGAALAVVSRRVEAAGGLLVTDDVLRGLERLGVASRTRTQARIAAVTGSVGKTGTKEMLRAMLSPQGATHAPVGSFNNHWGVPLTLARMAADTDYGVFEIGMNHSGEIRPLVGMVRPHVAMITTVEPVHIEYFSSEEEIARAKGEILEGIERGGTAVLNRDNRWFDLLASLARERHIDVLSFGEHEDADARITRLVSDGEGSSAMAEIGGEAVAFRVGAPGRHLVLNALGALACVKALGGDLAAASHALGRFSAPKGRGERHTLHHASGDFLLIDESYNANPASMRAAIEVLGLTQPQGRGRRMAVLGDMLELGPEAPARHAELADALGQAEADAVFLAGPMMEKLWEALPERMRGAHAETADALLPHLVDAVRPGDVICVKASLGTGLGAIVEALKGRFAPDAASA